MLRMTDIHINLITLMQLLKYKVDDKGACFGIGGKAIEAFFADDMETFTKRLDTLHQLIQTTSIKETAKRIQAAEEKRKALLETQRQALLSEWKLSPIISDVVFYKKLNEHKSSPSVIKYFDERKKIENQLTDQEKTLVDIKAFLDGVLIHQKPHKSSDLFEEGIINYEQNIEVSSLRTTPVNLSASIHREIKSGDIETKTQNVEHPPIIRQAKSWLGLYDENKLSQSLKLIDLKSKHLTSSFVIHISHGGHSTFLCYDTKTKKWIFIDANKLPPIEHSNFNKLAKDILDSHAEGAGALPLQFKVYCHENDKLSFQKWLNEITNLPEWIALQNVKETNPALLHMATHHGELETFKTIYASESKKPGFDITNVNGEDLLFTAAKDGHTDIIRYITQSDEFKENPGIIDQFGKRELTPFLTAAITGKTDIIKFLLELESFKVDINAATKSGTTALFLALRHGHTDIVKLLLEHTNPKVDIHKARYDYATADHIKAYPGTPKATPFEYAVTCNKPAIVQLFLESKHHTIDVNHHSSILKAAIAGRYDNVNLLIEHKADINLEEKGVNLLICAAKHGNHALIKLLNERIDCTIDINKQDANGYTALQYAVENNHVESVRALLTFKNQKININVLNKNNKNVLNIACHGGNKEILKILLEHFKNEMDPYQTDSFHQSALSNSTCTDNNILPIMLEAFPDIDLNRQTKIGITPFYNAAQNGNIHCVRMLIEKKVDINTPIGASISTLNGIAKKHNHGDALKKLFENKKINSDTLNGFTPLHAAVFFGHEQVVEALLEKKVNLNQVTDGGISALDLAQVMNHKKIITLLKKHLVANHALNEEKQILNPSQQEWYQFLLNCEEKSPNPELKAFIKNIIIQEEYLSFPKLTQANSLALLEGLIKKQAKPDEEHNNLLLQLSLLGLILIKDTLLTQSWPLGFFERSHLYTNSNEAKRYKLPSNIKKHIEILDSILKNPSDLKESFRKFSDKTRPDKRLNATRNSIDACCNIIDKLPEAKPRMKPSRR